MGSDRRGEFLRVIQERTARVAVSASATRGQRAPGLVKRARDFLGKKLRLEPFGVAEEALFRSALEKATEKLKARLPSGGRSWGLARKLLNIFLRDALYTTYLRDRFHLGRSEAFYEIPLDSITSGHLKRSVLGGQLPRWLGVKRLTAPASQKYQEVAKRVAAEKGIARVHLDADWWGGDRNTLRLRPRRRRP